MLIDLTADPLMRLLVDASRRAEVSGPALARVHREVGRGLAAHVAQHVPIEEFEFDHVVGKATGLRVRAGSEPIFVVLMRAGLFVAEGLWESFPGSSLVPYEGRDGPFPLLPATDRLVVVVDAVINTGKSLRTVLDAVALSRPAKVIAVTLVGYGPSVKALAEERPEIDIVAARLSERSYVGKGGTDTGARLFGTTTWASER